MAPADVSKMLPPLPELELYVWILPVVIVLPEEVIFTAPPAAAVELLVLILPLKVIAPPAEIFTGLLVAVMVADVA